MTSGISGAVTNNISQPPVINPVSEKIELIQPVCDTPLDPEKSDQEFELEEIESPRKPIDDWTPNFEWAVQCLAENSLRSVDFLTLSRISKYVKDNFKMFVRQAEDIHSFLENSSLPAVDPSKPVPSYVMSKVRSALYKEMGGLLRYLNAMGKYKEYRELILVGLFGFIPEIPHIAIASFHPKNTMDSLMFSVMSQLYIPFSELQKHRQEQRLEYYEMFYALLNKKEEQISEIQKSYSFYAPSRIEIDWLTREIKVSTATFQSIIYLAHKHFKDLFKFAIDQEMEVRVVYLILQVILKDRAALFHIPDHPAIFVIKDALCDVEKTSQDQNESCAVFLLTRATVQNHLTNFVENVLFNSNSVRLCLRKKEYGVGGAENDFPMDQIKAYFLSELKKVDISQLIQKVQKCPVLGQLLEGKEKLGKLEFSDFLRNEYVKFNNAKTTTEGNFIIHRMNQICDGVQFEKRELKGLSESVLPHIDFLFPLFVLQILMMTNDNFFDEFNRCYRIKKCIDGHCFSVCHEMDGLDAHKFIYTTNFSEDSVTAYSIVGTLSLDSFWSNGKFTMIPFKKISFSPFISFETFSRLSENIFLDIKCDAFIAEIVEQFISICGDFNQGVIDKYEILKDRLHEIVFIKNLLDDLNVDTDVYVDSMVRLKSFEEAIRHQMWVSKDPQLSHNYLRMYGEDGFLRKGY